MNSSYQNKTEVQPYQLTPRLYVVYSATRFKYLSTTQFKVWVYIFLDLHLSISNGFVSSKIYDKRDDFDFDIVNFPFLDGEVPRRTSYGVYILLNKSLAWVDK